MNRFDNKMEASFLLAFIKKTSVWADFDLIYDAYDNILSRHASSKAHQEHQPASHSKQDMVK